MAQRTGKEDTDFKVPETLTLCINNCGVTGNPATNNMCQTCFNATNFTFTSTSFSPTAATASAGPSILKLSDDQSSRSTPSRLQDNRSASALPKTAATTKNSRTFASNRSGKTDPSAGAEKQVVNRCSGSRKRVGLTGFRCRCGELFCAEHRYSDRHDCSYDYKAAGREAIARENPIVKAAKIIRV